MCGVALTLLLQSLLCPHSRFPVNSSNSPCFFDHTHFLGHCAKTWRFFQFACGYGCPLFFQLAYLPAQYMLYAVKLQGIYTAYSYLSVRATVDLPLPENSIHAILFQLRLLAQRLLFALTSKPQNDIIISATRGSCQKNCQRDTNRL
ncbi:MAG: hypothetical protein ACLUZX_03885 [Subdoligranulum sp.]